MTAPITAKGGQISADDVRSAYYDQVGASNYALWITEAHLEGDAPSLIVADSDARKTYRVPVTLASGKISFGDPVEVLPAYVDASADDGAEVEVFEAEWRDPHAAAAYDEDGLDSSWDSLDDLPDLTGLDVADFEAVDGSGGGAPSAAAKLGTGSRFKSLKSKLAARGAKNPGALAAWIGRKKYGKARFGKLASAARSRKAHAAADHPFTGKHTHSHPALGTQGGDEMHEHEHSHQGDADHAHDHPARASTEGATEVDFSEDQERRIRLALGIPPEVAELEPEAVTAAAEELGKRADAKVHASYKPPEGAIVVAKEAWDGLQNRVRQGELAREAQLRGERDTVLNDAVRQGKFSAANRGHWERMWQSDPEGTRAAIGTLQRNAVPIEDIGRPGGGPDDLLDDEYQALFPPAYGA